VSGSPPRIGNYTVRAELGRGGQGTVYRAAGPNGREVAVKVLLRPNSPGALARFERERRLLAELCQDEGFVPLLEAGETHGASGASCPFFVMPLLGGGTLRARFERGPLGIDETVALGARLAGALGRAHARGIVHRDLKPENVLFSRDGEAFVSDLGLAKHFVPDAAGANQTLGLSLQGELRGTAGYMAPEQARDARNAGPAADVFSLGAILYESLAGFPAFRAENVIGLLGKVENESPTPVSEVRPDVPPWLARAVTKALARKPEERFPNAAALALVLRTSGREGLAPRSRKRLVLAAAAGLALLGAAVGVAGTLSSAGAGAPSPSPRPSASPPQTRPRSVSLLELTPTTLNRDGEWRVQNGRVSFKGTPSALLNFPVYPTGTYSIEARFTRIGGKNGLGVHIPVGDQRSALLIVAGYENTLGGGLGGLERIDNHRNIQQPLTLTIGLENVLVVRVDLKEHEAHIVARLNAIEFVDWRGDRARLSLADGFDVFDPGGIGLTAWDGATFTVSQFTVKGELSTGER
jgi:serine/threonine protein kinase